MFQTVFHFQSIVSGGYPDEQLLWSMAEKFFSFSKVDQGICWCKRAFCLLNLNVDPNNNQKGAWVVSGGIILVFVKILSPYPGLGNGRSCLSTGWRITLGRKQG